MKNILGFGKYRISEDIDLDDDGNRYSNQETSLPGEDLELIEQNCRDCFQDFLDILEGESLDITIGAGSIAIKIYSQDPNDRMKGMDLIEYLSQFWKLLGESIKKTSSQLDVELYRILLDKQESYPKRIDMVFKR